MAWLKDLFIGEINIQPYIPPRKTETNPTPSGCTFTYVSMAEYFVDTQDVARLHLAGLIDPTVSSERIFAYTEPYTWNQVLGLFRKLYPDRKFVEDIPDQGVDASTVANERTVEILKHMGKDGLTSLEESIQWTVEEVL